MDEKNQSTTNNHEESRSKNQDSIIDIGLIEIALATTAAAWLLAFIESEEGRNFGILLWNIKIHEGFVSTLGLGAFFLSAFASGFIFLAYFLNWLVINVFSKFDDDFYTKYAISRAAMRGCQANTEYAEALLEKPILHNGPFYEVNSVKDLLKHRK